MPKMVFYMIFDVETTGFLKTKPYIVSIAYNVYELETAKELEPKLVLENYDIVKPHDDSYEFPKESVAIHGITTEYAKKNGITIQEVILKLHNVFDTYPIDTIIAHNISFDVGVLSIQLNRYDTHPNKLKDKIYNIKSFCTMRESTDMVNIQRESALTGKKYTKFPKLIELYQYLFPNENFKQHDAKCDVDACARCYFQMVHNIKL